MFRWRVKTAIALAVILAASILAAQEDVIRVNVNLVNVIATVRNASGEIVGNLQKQDFEILDNGARQEVAFLHRQTDRALSIALLDLPAPDDFVIATGVGHTVRDLVSHAFGLVNMDWQKYVRVDDALVRRGESVPIVGDSAKLRRTLGTAPKVAFETTLKVLLAHDLKQLGCQVPFPVPAT